MFKTRLQSKYVLLAEDHSLYTDDSGKYWGAQGAGGIFYAEDTKCLCFAKRSKLVNEPNTWGTWGGALDEGETPEQAVRREVEEEAGYSGKFTLKELYVFQDKKFRYTNFLIVVPKQFTPKMDWETQDFAWVGVDKIPTPLHPGAQKLLPHLKKFLEKYENSKASPKKV